MNEGETAQAVLARAAVSDEELLARLVNAESISTGYPDDPQVYRAIAWGVMNRVRLAERSTYGAKHYGSGVAGVIFKAGQFNPAVSPRSKFRKELLCPAEPTWSLAL